LIVLITWQDGFTPLAVAVQQGHEAVIAELVNASRQMVNGDVGGAGGGGGTLPSRGGRSSQRSPPALHVAARKDDVTATTHLLQQVVSTGQPAEVRATSSLIDSCAAQPLARQYFSCLLPR